MDQLTTELGHVKLEPLSNTDTYTVELLELVEKYQEIAKEYREEYIKGFLELSRANFNARGRFGVEKFDRREYDACIVVNGDGLELIDRLEVQGAKSNEKDDAEEDSETSQKLPKNVQNGDQIPSEGIQPLKSLPEKQPSLKKLTRASQNEQEITERTIKSPKVSEKEKEQASEQVQKAFRNPIYQFSALPPPPLRQAQATFSKAIRLSISLKQLQTEIERLISVISKASST